MRNKEDTLNAGELLGLIGGALTTLGFIPQVVRVLRLRSAREISLPFTWSFLIGIACWFAYGIYVALVPVIMWNGISLVLAGLLLYAKLRYGAPKSATVQKKDAE